MARVASLIASLVCFASALPSGLRRNGGSELPLQRRELGIEPPFLLAQSGVVVADALRASGAVSANARGESIFKVVLWTASELGPDARVTSLDFWIHSKPTAFEKTPRARHMYTRKLHARPVAATVIAGGGPFYQLVEYSFEYKLRDVPRGKEVFMTLGNVVINDDPTLPPASISISAAGASASACPPGTIAFRGGVADAAHWRNTNCNVLYVAVPPVGANPNGFVVGQVTNYYPQFNMGMRCVTCWAGGVG